MIVFNGIKEAKKIENQVKAKIKKLGFTPKLKVISFGQSKYLELKKKLAEKVGIELTVTNIFSSTSGLVNGVMIQVPVPEDTDLQKLISQIPIEKDVDGMSENSLYVAPVVLAVKHALNVAGYEPSMKIVVVGAEGFVGGKMVKYFNAESIDLEDNLNELKDYDVIISATGKPGLIKESMVKQGVVAIDVGAPKPEFDKSVYEKASFYTPVPGGIGPLTISYLLENVANSARI